MNILISDKDIKEIRNMLYSCIVEHYVNEIKLIVTNNRSIELKTIWGDLADLLNLDESSKARYQSGKNKKGKVPSSSFDGRIEPHEPGLEQLLQYVAATDRKLEFPRGRTLTNRACASVLYRVRKHKFGYIGTSITPEEVEILRFMRQLSRNVSVAHFQPIRMKDLKNSNYYKDLMGLHGNPNASDQMIAELFVEWNASFNIMIIATGDLTWLRGN